MSQNILHFYIKTVGDYVTDSDVYIDYNKPIYFMPDTKLDKAILDSFIVSSKTKEYTQLFTSKDIFNEFSDFTSRLKSKPLQTTEKESIQFMSNLFFPYKSTLTISNQAYIITTKTIPIASYAKDTEYILKNPSLFNDDVEIQDDEVIKKNMIENNNYYVKLGPIELVNSKKISALGNGKHTCEERAEILDDQFYNLFGYSMNFSKSKTKKPSTTIKPVFYSTDDKRLTPPNKFIRDKNIIKSRVKDFNASLASIKKSIQSNIQKRKDKLKKNKSLAADLERRRNYWKWKTDYKFKADADAKANADAKAKAKAKAAADAKAAASTKVGGSTRRSGSTTQLKKRNQTKKHKRKIKRKY